MRVQLDRHSCLSLVKKEPVVQAWQDRQARMSVLQLTRKSVLLQPVARINYFSSTGYYNLALPVSIIVSPFNSGAATWHQDVNVPLGFAFGHRGHRGRAGTGSGSHGFAYATFPDPQFNRFSILDPNKHYVGAIGKLSMIFQGLSDRAANRALRSRQQRCSRWDYPVATPSL